MTRPLRVAMVGLRAPWGTEGGVEHVVGALAPRLARLGCAVTVYCRRRYNALGPGIHHGVRLVDVDTVYGKHTEALLHTALAAPRAALTHDVVHLHASGPALFAGIPRLLRRATVVTVHALDWQRDKWGLAAQAALRLGGWSAVTFPHETIAVAAHVAQHLADQHGARATVIPNAADPIADADLAEAGVPGLRRRGYLLYLGRIVPEKDLPRLFAAARAAGLDEMPILVTGSAIHAEDHLRALQPLAPDNVVFTGPRHGRARDALLRHAAALVNPSRLEGLPLAPLEAMAAGTPVLLSDIEPHREIIDAELDGVGGWLVPDDGWVEALGRLGRATPEALDEMGARAQARVDAVYSWDRVAERTLAVYQQALAARGRR